MPKRKRAASKETASNKSWKRPRYGTVSLSASHVSKLVARPQRRFGRAAKAGPNYPRSDHQNETPKFPSWNSDNAIDANVTLLPQSLVASPSMCQPINDSLDNTKPTLNHAYSSTALSTPKDDDYREENEDSMTTNCHNNKSYQYTPLADGQIRLLKILPGTDEDALKIKLETVDDTSTRSYEALSYCWGDQSSQETIIITDEDHRKTSRRAAVHVESKGLHLDIEKIIEDSSSVGRNLASALRMLRRRRSSSYLWIDSICINQADHNERAAQVRMMPDIYTSAEKVVIWLGDGDHDSLKSQIAMETIPDIVDTKRHAAMLVDDDQIWKWASVLELMNNDWFKRLWVIQEVAFAKKAVVQSGDARVDWKDFRDAIALCSEAFKALRPKLIRHLEALHPEKKHWLLDPDFEVEQLAANRMIDALTSFHRNSDGTLKRTKSLETLVCLFQGFASSDPRDKVFALLNLAKDRDSLSADYSKSTFEVYQQFVQHCVTTSRSLDIICHQWARASTPDPQLPSWLSTEYNFDVPSKANHNLVRGRRATDTFVGLPGTKAYAACGTGYLRKAPMIEFPGATIINGDVVQNNYLLIRGVAIGRISFCTESMTDCVIPQTCFEKLGWSCAARGKSRNPVPDRLCRTLVADRGPNGSRSPPWYDHAAQHCLYDLLRNGHLNIDRAIHTASSYAVDYLTRVRDVIRDRTFIEAETYSSSKIEEEQNIVGLGPPNAQDGDVIAILYGLSVPVVLRPVRSFDGTPGFCFVGEAYVDGRMEGEIFDTDYEETMFKLV